MPKTEQYRQRLRLADGGEVEVLRVRDPRARRLRLLVNERGVRLTVPRGASEQLAEAFLHEQRDWLLVQLAKRPRELIAPVLLPSVTSVLPLRGASLPVLWRCGRYARVALSDDGIEICLPEHAGAARTQAVLREFYLAQARADIGRWLPRYLPGLPRAPSQFRLRPLRSLWGSLSSAGALSLDLALVLGRPAAFEYVLVHELCHLLQTNHSPAFWREVELRCPHWCAEREYLRGDGLALKKTLAGLLIRQ